MDNHQYIIYQMSGHRELQKLAHTCKKRSIDTSLDSKTRHIYLYKSIKQDHENKRIWSELADLADELMPLTLKIEINQINEGHEI